MKLATWNLALPIAQSHRNAARAWTDRIAADIWVLTETHDGFTPGHRFSTSSAAGRDGHHEPEHRWATIWSRHRLERLTTRDEKRTVAARVYPDDGPTFVIYGTVLPWIGSRWREQPGDGGVAFREALKVQASDWLSIRQAYPDDGMFILGDFNQDLVRPHYYGSNAGRERLAAALDNAGLMSLTAGDRDPVRRDSAPFACIDHICALRNSRWLPGPAMRWPDLPKPEGRLSDHFGIAVTFELAATGCRGVVAEVMPPFRTTSC